VVSGAANGELITVADELLIGRDAPGAGSLAGDEQLSRRHARIADDRGDGGYTIEDLGSTNGTFVNGARVESARTLAPGDTIQVGSAGLLVKRLPKSASPPGKETTTHGVVPTPAVEAPVVDTPVEAAPVVAIPALDLQLRIDFEAREVHLSSSDEPDVRLVLEDGRWRMKQQP
jgi:predicted component of type VI protein secretion system